MASELDRFFAELGGRRQRLLQLVQPADADNANLIDELTELGEQLIIAEEELRVQQEELTAVSDRLTHMLQEREELRTASPYPYVLTDRRGVVLRANPAAERLIRHPAVRATPRPIATWFEVADRPVIREMISRVVSGRQAQAKARATIRRPDHSFVTVWVTATSTAADDTDRLALQWELRSEEQDGEQPRLQLVPAPDAATDRQLAGELTALAVDLAGCDSEERLLALAVERAGRLVGGHAGVLLRGRRGALSSDPAAGELVLACDQQQLGLGEGPALTALAERGQVVVADTAAEPRWPSFGPAAAELGVRSLLASPITTGDAVLGVLTLHAERPNAFDESARFTASLVAVQLGLMLEQLRMLCNLRAGMANRELIGEAIGVLVERRRITSRQAFQLLMQASQQHNIKLRDIARIVVDTGQDPSQLESR